MRRTLGIALLAVALTAGASLAAPRPPAAGSTALSMSEDFPQPDSAQILKSVRRLASEDFAGRRTGDPGCAAAAAWIAARFAEYGLTPLGDSGTYLQSFEATVGVRDGGHNRLATRGPGGSRTWLPDSDFTALGFSENDSLADVPVVFVGYGVTADEKGYDDYAGVDVKGKVALFLRYLPADEDSTAPFGPSGRSRYADLRYKASNAFNHGARAAVAVLGPASHKDAPDVALPLRSDQGVGGGHIPVLSVRREVAEELLRTAATNMKDLRPDSTGSLLGALQGRIDTARKPGPVALEGPAVSLATDLLRDRRRVANVAGVLHGEDAALRDECVVIGAHYDHLGMGGPGSLEPDRKAIHFGADDNASGTAGVLELARCFSGAGTKPKRNVVFVCFVGEEEGLFGSGHFVNHSPVPIEKISAMINMDMIGRLKDDKVFIAGAGTSPLFPGLLAEAAKARGIVSSPQASGYGPSDHTSFYAKDRPVLFFFSGAHTDYHKPSDTWDKINAPGEAKVLAMVSDVARALCARDSAIAFTKVLADSSRGGGGEGYGGGGYGPYLGTVPDFGENPEVKGVLLSGVREGSPAEKAGILGKDVIVKFDGKVVGNLQDYFYALSARKPGDVVKVELMRAGQPVTITVTLGKRPGK
ncbi:MAG: M20/M25/M40 family metallo-hydrolase [Candidatus Eisenbacteria bacterium]|nr:M20/M25/M40 family metallo-hydrolase [Candidatus Eisenbacteria bacterium]